MYEDVGIVAENVGSCESLAFAVFVSVSLPIKVNCLEYVNQAGNNKCNMMTDPIADMLTRIRNAQMVRKGAVNMPYSKLKFAIAGILAKEGYIAGVRTEEHVRKELVLDLIYTGKTPKIQSIIRESKPGHRNYRKADELPHILNGYGIAIISTSKGLMSDKDARSEGLGGEVLCSVY